MLRFRTFAAAAALALSAASAPAALMDNNCRVRLTCFETANGVYASVRVDATWGAMIDGDLHLVVNGQEVKVDPILTDDTRIYNTWIGAPGATVTTCARLVGVNWITEESTLPADTTACAFYSSEMGSRPNQPRSPREVVRRQLPLSPRLQLEP